MYGIYANIWGILMVNVTIYSIHGSYGLYCIIYICILTCSILGWYPNALPACFDLHCQLWTGKRTGFSFPNHNWVNRLVTVKWMRFLAMERSNPASACLVVFVSAFVCGAGSRSRIANKTPQKWGFISNFKKPWESKLRWTSVNITPKKIFGFSKKRLITRYFLRYRSAELCLELASGVNMASWGIPVTEMEILTGKSTTHRIHVWYIC